MEYFVHKQIISLIRIVYFRSEVASSASKHNGELSFSCSVAQLTYNFLFFSCSTLFSSPSWERMWLWN